MSRLSRLRSFWRSLRRGKIRDGGWSPYRAVNLLPPEYRAAGGLRPDGSWVLSASTTDLNVTRPGQSFTARGSTADLTTERALSPRTPGTATTAVSSSFCQPGNPWAGAYVQTSPHHGSSFTERGWSTGATGIPGASGAPRGPAV